MRGFLIRLGSEVEGAEDLFPPVIGRSAGGYGKELMPHNGLRLHCLVVANTLFRLADSSKVFRNGGLTPSLLHLQVQAHLSKRTWFCDLYAG